MNTGQKPTIVQIIAWAILVSGVVNIGFGIAAFTTFFGWICAPVSVLPIVLGAFELVYAAKLLGSPIQPVTPSTNIAVFEIASIVYGNVFSMAVGILTLVFYNDTVVKDYFAQLNEIIPVEFQPAHQAPASLPDPRPAPATEDPESAPKKEPAKSKRPPRKLAKK